MIHEYLIVKDKNRIFTMEIPDNRPIRLVDESRSFVDENNNLWIRKDFYDLICDGTIRRI